jgi:hypothetical protein
VIKAEKGQTFVVSTFTDMKGLLQKNEDLQKSLLEVINRDRDKLTLPQEFTLALALYAVGETDPFDRIITRTKKEIELFGDLARLIRAGSQLVAFKDKDEKLFVELAIIYMAKSGMDPSKQNQFFNAVIAFESVYKDEHLNSQGRTEVLKTLEDQFRAFRTDIATRDRILRLAAQIDRDKAKGWYYAVMTCESSELSEVLFNSTQVSELLLQSEVATDYASTKEAGQAFLKQVSVTCEGWNA